MIRRIAVALVCMVALTLIVFSSQAQAQQGTPGKVWGGGYNTHDWERFYHYPYVYYPQNFWGSEYYRSGNSLYYRYPPEMQIPVYNKKWQNYYPQSRLYHSGNHFILDVF